MNEVLPFPWNVVVPIVVALIAAVPGALAFIKQRRRSKAETADILTTAAERLVKGMESRIKALMDRVKCLEQEVDAVRADLRVALEKVADLESENRAQAEVVRVLLKGVKALTAQLVDAGMTPTWTPPEKEEGG